MKKHYVTFLACAMILLSISIVEFCLYNISYNDNKKESEKELKIAYDSINTVNNDRQYPELPQSWYVKVAKNLNNGSLKNGVESEVSNYKQEILCENNIIGVLVIKKLQIEAPIKEGTSQDVMKTSIGHFVESDYWNGNVSLASHNSGTSVHYFEKINKLGVNDEIEYITKLGTKVYKVQSINKIDEDTW